MNLNSKLLQVQILKIQQPNQMGSILWMQFLHLQETMSLSRLLNPLQLLLKLLLIHRMLLIQLRPLQLQTRLQLKLKLLHHNLLKLALKQLLNQIPPLKLIILRLLKPNQHSKPLRPKLKKPLLKYKNLKLNQNLSLCHSLKRKLNLRKRIKAQNLKKRKKKIKIQAL